MSILIFFIVIFFIFTIVSKRKPLKKLIRGKLTNQTHSLKEAYPNLEGTIFQALESLYIIYNSVNIQTVENRMVFFHTTMWALSSETKEKYYPVLAQKAIDKYRQKYYDRTLHDEIIQIIRHSGIYLDNSDKYFSEFRFKAYVRYADEEQRKITALKTKAGKENRRDSLILAIKRYRSTYKILGDHLDWANELIEKLTKENNNNIKA